MTSPQIVLRKASDFASKTRPTWCPGCGHYGVLSALKTAAADLNLDPDYMAIISGIGCSSNFPHFMSTYGAHTIHGRALPFAMGVKLANPELTVIVTTGDGDGLGIGGNHFIHAARRNLDLTHIVMNNAIYGLTTGQASPTTWMGEITKSTPLGYTLHEPHFKEVAIALAAGATFVARAFSGDKDQMAEIFKKAIKHRGYAFIDARSPCVTYQKSATYDFYREHTYNLQKMGHDTSDLMAAFKEAQKGDRTGNWPVGIFYEVDRAVYEDFEPAYELGPLHAHPLGLKNNDPILQRFY